MQRSNRAVGAALLLAGWGVVLPALAAQTAPAAPPVARQECALPAAALAQFEARRAQGGLTREEVRAQVELWRASGMAQLSRARPLPDIFSDSYRRHYAAYERMRNGPEYEAALCHELQDGLP